MKKRMILYALYLGFLILFVGMKFTGSFSELWMKAALVRENREAGVLNANLTPFHTISIYLRLRRNPIYLKNLVGNIIPFIPLGFFPAIVRKQKSGILFCFFTMLRGLSVVLFIELFQLVTGLGYFDVDDILLNMCGCLIGYLLYLLPFFYAHLKLKSTRS